LNISSYSGVLFPPGLHYVLIYASRKTPKRFNHNFYVPMKLVLPIFLDVILNLTLQNIEFLRILYKNSVLTSQEIHYVSATKTKRLVLFRQRVGVHFKNNPEHTSTLYGENAEI
jgi:hypothetical protein